MNCGTGAARSERVLVVEWLCGVICGLRTRTRPRKSRHAGPQMVRVYGCDGGRRFTGGFHDDSWFPGDCRCLASDNEKDIIQIFATMQATPNMFNSMLFEHASDRTQSLFWHPSRKSWRSLPEPLLHTVTQVRSQVRTSTSGTH